MANKALLIGNDINNATETFSWANLIQKLLVYANINKPINQINKPFPLLYEEIYLNYAQLHRSNELKIKEFIAKQTARMKPNPLHEAIINLGIPNILTTNYDLLFENAAGLQPHQCINQGIIKEKKYNLFRHHQTANHTIWHLHGSQTDAASITLGYEHYSGSLQQMRNYAATGTGTSYKNYSFKPLVKRLNTLKPPYQCWLDFFFTTNVYIFGLSLDFVEMDLWWLLTYRARIIANKKFKNPNRIVYFYPEAYKETMAHKLEMLAISQVETIAVPMQNGKLAYYQNIIAQIEKE